MVTKGRKTSMVGLCGEDAATVLWIDRVHDNAANPAITSLIRLVWITAHFHTIGSRCKGVREERGSIDTCPDSRFCGWIDHGLVWEDCSNVREHRRDTGLSGQAGNGRLLHLGGIDEKRELTHPIHDTR